jgi:NADH dehydrogenase
MVIWGMFTGSYSYRRIFIIALGPLFLARLFLAVVRERARSISSPWQAGKKLAQTSGTRVLVLGGGFGGVHTVLRLEKALCCRPGIDLTLVSNENFFLFTPLLHEVATGGVETRHIAYPYRRLRGNRKFNFFQREIRSIDLAAKKVVTDQEVLSYDFLVLALGSVTDTAGLPAFAKNVFTLKSLVDGIFLRNHIINMFEQADLVEGAEQEKMLTFIVVGGGYTGVQLVTEMRDFIIGSLIRHYPRVQRRIGRLILVQGQERILPDFDEKLAAYAFHQLREQGIEVRLRSRVTKVWDDGVELNGAESLPTCTVVWVAGVNANPVVAGLPVEKDSSGRVKVNDYLEVPGFPGVYALGDNAHVKDNAGHPLPATAHIAVRQPKVAAANILADLVGRPKRTYRYSYMGQLVSLGSRSGVVKFYGLRLPGLSARIIWLVIYLNIMAGLYNRTRVALDWLLGLIFGRDITLLRLRQRGD